VLQWLQAIPAERVLLWVFLAGGAWSQLRAARASLRDQGQRIGKLERLVARLELLVQREREGGDGR
jgi:hypothetical protein